MASINSKGKGKKKRYIVRYDGAPDPETGQRKQLQKTFYTNQEAEEFAAQVTLDRNFQGVSPHQRVMLTSQKEVVQIPFSDFATS